MERVAVTITAMMMKERSQQRESRNDVSPVPAPVVCYMSRHVAAFSMRLTRHRLRVVSL
jgi:hypothetical protein